VVVHLGILKAQDIGTQYKQGTQNYIHERNKFSQELVITAGNVFPEKNVEIFHGLPKQQFCNVTEESQAAEVEHDLASGPLERAENNH
jgi:hypothetical protein